MSMLFDGDSVGCHNAADIRSAAAGSFMPHTFKHATLIALSLGAAPVLAADGQRTFNVGTYDVVIVEGDISVTIDNDAPPSAKASGNPKLLNMLQFDRNGQTVKIRLVPATQTVGVGINMGTVQVQLAGRNVRKITVRGSGVASINTVKGTAAYFDLRGPGAISVGSLTSERVITLVNGSGRFSVANGKISDASVKVNGTASVNMGDALIDTLNLSQAGAADTGFKVKSKATVSNSGSGKITITGTATCTVVQGGSGSISCPEKGGKP